MTRNCRCTAVGFCQLQAWPGTSDGTPHGISKGSILNAVLFLSLTSSRLVFFSFYLLFRSFLPFFLPCSSPYSFSSSFGAVPRCFVSHVPGLWRCQSQSGRAQGPSGWQASLAQLAAGPLPCHRQDYASRFPCAASPTEPETRRKQEQLSASFATK